MFLFMGFLNFFPPSPFPQNVFLKADDCLQWRVLGEASGLKPPEILEKLQKIYNS